MQFLPPLPFIMKIQHWRRTPFPTLEFTTNIAEKGCVVDCAFCPQRILENSYTGKRLLTLDEFKLVVDKLPKEVRCTFAGFTEPFLNKYCTDMVEYAHAAGHPVSVFTTAVGIKPDDVYRLAKIPYAGNPNGGFCLHLPDQERIAKHPINNTYIQTIKAFHEVHASIQNFYVMCMGFEVHESVREYFPHAVIPHFWNRAGNLTREAIVKPELLKLASRVNNAPLKKGPHTCGCVEDLYHNVLLPNGDVSLCCMDYSLDYILGNLFTQEYDDVVPKWNSCFAMCRSCENGVKPKEESV